MNTEKSGAGAIRKGTRRTQSSISLAIHEVGRVSAEMIEYANFTELLLTVRNRHGERIGGISFLSTNGAPVLEVDGTPRKANP